MSDTKDLSIYQGKTFSLAIRWETEPIVRRPITGVSLESGAPRLEVVGHGCPNGWRTAVTMVKGMVRLNAANTPPKPSDYRQATVIDANHVEFNDVTPVDDNGREWTAWESGGFLQWNTPVNLAGYSARIKIKDKVGGKVLASNDPADDVDGQVRNVITIDVDAVGNKITMTIAATSTDDFTWKGGVYELEMVSASGVVTSILSGKVTVTKEVAV